MGALQQGARRLRRQNRDVVGSLADRVAVLYAGRVVEQGRTEDVFANPAHPYTRYLVAAPVMSEGRIIETEPTAALPASPREEYTKRLIADTPEPRARSG